MENAKKGRMNKNKSRDGKEYVGGAVNMTFRARSDTSKERMTKIIIKKKVQTHF